MTKWWRRTQPWQEKCQKIIKAIRKELSGSRDAVQITATAGYGKHWDAIKSDAELLHHLAMHRSFYDQVREELKNCNADDGDGITAEQIELWPEADQRALVRDIGRQSIYVPSRHAYVPVDPSEITPVEMIEAGRYLKRQAKETDLRGERCIELGERAGWSPAA